VEHSLAVLPMRLCCWKTSSDNKSFAYGGEEVEVSLWDTERAFSQPIEDEMGSTQKRKRGGILLPAETWRAKNVGFGVFRAAFAFAHGEKKVPNDSLSLRQPVHVTSLSYLPSSMGGPSTTHLIAGTNDGHVRRYDTRAARRPVADWRSIAKAGAVKVMEDGQVEQ
jgi:ribosome biogenesis protein NSA1